MLQQLFNAPAYTLNPLAIPVLVVAIVFFFFSFKTLLQENLRMSVGFFLLGIAIAIWLASNFFLYCATDAAVALWWARASHVGLPFIPAALYHFTVSILQAHHQYQKSIWTAWILSVFFSLVIVSTDLVIGEVKFFWWGYSAQYKPLSLLYLLFFVIFQALSLLRLVQAYQEAAPGSTSSLRNKSVLIAFCIASISFVDFLPQFGIAVYPFGYIPILVSIFLMHRVIQRFHLVDITTKFASQAIIDTMRESLLVLDVDGIIRLVNRSTVELLGYPEHELLGKNVSVVFGNELFLQHIVAISNDGTIENYEVPFEHPKGHVLILDISTSLMKHDRERPLAYVFIARDITHIKQTNVELIEARAELERRVEERSRDLLQANEQLKQEKAFSDAIIDSFPGIFFICDERGRLVRWNEKEMTGYSHHEILQMDVLHLFPEERERVANFMAGVIEHGQATAEASLMTKSGMTVPFYLTGYRMLTKQRPYFIGLGINISERISLEQQLHQSQKMEAIGILAGGIAHDFNNILTAIVGYTTLLTLKIQPDHPLYQNVNQILLSAERAAALTKSLLAFSRKEPISLQPLDLNNIISELNSILTRTIGEDVQVQLRLSAEKLLVKADKGQLEQVLMNLATNSRDAMPKGGILSITTDSIILQQDTGDIKSGRYAIISVADTGMGIDTKKQQHIFEPFYTTKEVGKGTGLGLAIVYGIIKKHNGAIRVTSEPARGTTFTIYLPLTESKISEKTTSDHVLPLRGSETILLVEDDAIVRQLTKTILEAYGYRVLEAADGEDAVTIFQQNGDTVHLVLCDLIMPRKNGKETYDDLIKIRRDIKIIFISGYTADILSQKGLKLDTFHVIAKPFSPVTLLGKMRAVLDAR